MRFVWAKLREWGGVAAFCAIILVVSLLVVRDSANDAAIEQRQRVIIAALAEENNEAIQANGDFQTCVWRAIIRPRIQGHTHRAARAIRQCDARYLS